MPLTERRERLVFWCGVGLLWALFATLAALTPVILDDWFQLAFIKRHGLSLASLWRNAVHNYHHYNPRLGENVLLLVNGPPIINVLLTPTIEVLFLVGGFAIALGRWPRPNVRDAQLLLVLLAMVWLAAPVPGIMFTYRPFCTNYLYSLTAMLWFLVPYRFAVARPRRTPWWLTPLLLVAGWVSGMGNEHVGPTLALVVIGLGGLHWRMHRRLPAWMVAGLLGLLVGYAMLFFAPGQLERYGSTAARVGPLGQIVERGVGGTVGVLIEFLWEAQGAVLVVVIGVFAALYQAHRHTRPAPSPDRRAVLTMLALVLSGLAIVATLFASPTVGERLFLAPATAFAIACLVLVEVLSRDRRARQSMFGFAASSVVANFAWGFVVYGSAYVEGIDREGRLAAAPRGSTLAIPPLSRISRNPWFLGEDLDGASLREYIARELYGLAALDFERTVFAEPSVPYHMRLSFTMEPPMSDDEVWTHLVAPLAYVPSYPDRDVQLIRRLVPQVRKIPGHRLRAITAYVDGAPLPELHGRPLVAARWRDGQSFVLDYSVRVDDDLREYFLLFKGTYPDVLTDAHVAACGKTRSPALKHERRGIRISYVPWCRGIEVAVVCNAEECWLVGTHWH